MSKKETLLLPPFPVSVLGNFHPNHPLNHALGLVPIQLIVLVLYRMFLCCVLFVRVTQAPTANASSVVLMGFNIRTPTKISKPK